MSTDAVTDFSPIALFAQADIVVKVIMLGLLAASIWTWAIIVAQILKNRRAHAASDLFEAEIREAGITGESSKHLARDASPAAALFKAAMAEWSKSVRARASLDKDAARERIAEPAPPAASSPPIEPKAAPESPPAPPPAKPAQLPPSPRPNQLRRYRSALLRPRLLPALRHLRHQRPHASLWPRAGLAMTS